MAKPRDVYEVLRTRIISGDHGPGSHLAEEIISEDLGVSRTPVRTALRRLADDGLVTIEPHRGAFVAEYTRADIDEVFELRQILEERGARLAASRRTDAQLRKMDRLVNEMAVIAAGRKPSRLDDLHRNNKHFHELVLEAASSPRQFRIATSLAQTSVTLGTFFYYSDEDIDRSVEFHRAITHAIRLRQSQVAGSLMSAHLAVAQHSFVSQRFSDQSEEHPAGNTAPTPRPDGLQS